MKETLECLHNSTQKITQGMFKGFYCFFSPSLFLDVGKNVIKYARQAHYNDPWILMASFLIDNYRHWHTELRRKKKKNERENVSR